MNFTPDDIAKVSDEVFRVVAENHKKTLKDDINEMCDENGKIKLEEMIGFMIAESESFSVDFTTALLQKLAESCD